MAFLSAADAGLTCKACGKRPAATVASVRFARAQR
jgi:hypothetical protein